MNSELMQKEKDAIARLKAFDPKDEPKLGGQGQNAGNRILDEMEMMQWQN